MEVPVLLAEGDGGHGAGEQETALDVTVEEATGGGEGAPAVRPCAHAR